MAQYTTTRCLNSYDSISFIYEQISQNHQFFSYRKPTVSISCVPWYILSWKRFFHCRPMVSIKETEKKIIFMNIKELGEVHAAFYTSLLESVSGKQVQSLFKIKAIKLHRFSSYFFMTKHGYLFEKFLAVMKLHHFIILKGFSFEYWYLSLQLFYLHWTF